ncbi:type VI secretion system ATPase TssH [Comamonas sp. NoAH]|uniref:type VI secretion system ATPase TssH n=1 Tax=Comamonas halotolerans TaxID=3041496 RepID=UPI0024E1185A|nr:type VI secretion system ATPase TssH [Comamonas sp. NoAH]
MTTSLKTLITKLNGVSRLATQRAANICMAQGHYEVDLEHLFLALLEHADSDFATILKSSGVSASGLRADLEHELAGFKNGNTRTPVFSQYLQKLLQHAWLLASLDEGAAQIRSGHLLLALLTESDLAQLALRGSTRFAQISKEDLKHRFHELTRGSSEVQDASHVDSPVSSGVVDTASAVHTPALDQYTNDLTAHARDGKLDPVIGRDPEIRQMIDVLMRRRQNNPILTGEAGVGKTAVVEGLALRIVAGDVPEPLRNVSLRVLDLGLLQAGASVKGEFENRLKGVIDEVKKSPTPIILFIDEAHTMIGAGGAAGQSDAANLLKPPLARGELRTIAATTWAEYKKYFEKDVALARRFQVVKVDEPSEELAAAMLRGMVSLMSKHFGITVMDEAVTEAVRLSNRYITGRQLPDKAVSVLDTACARVALGQSATPAQIDDGRKLMSRLQQEIQALQADMQRAGETLKSVQRLDELTQRLQLAQDQLAQDESRLASEQVLVQRIQTLRAAMAQSAPTTSQDRSELHEALQQLRTLQGESGIVPLQVDGHVVAEIVSSWTGIPLGRMVKDEIRTVRGLAPLLAERVIGQDHALEAVAQRVRTASARLEDPNKPRGVFMFVGPSGVGKTETALALADILYGGEKKLVTINMSEYQEAHSVSGLKGSPPGYVGYGEGGVLTEAVRRNPYSVVLLDEVEKAHPDVLEMFFQVFDKGEMDDAEGRSIDFRNTLIILTSNVGSTQIMQTCLNKPAQELPEPDALVETLRPVLFKHFKPAFLGRMKVVPYYPISDDVLEGIIKLKLGRIRDRVQSSHSARFEWTEAVVDTILARCTEVDSGARNVDHIINGTLLPAVAGAVLDRMVDGQAIARVKVTASKGGDFKYKVE